MNVWIGYKCCTGMQRDLRRGYDVHLCHGCSDWYRRRLRRQTLYRLLLRLQKRLRRVLLLLKNDGGSHGGMRMRVGNRSRGNSEWRVDLMSCGHRCRRRRTNSNSWNSVDAAAAARSCRSSRRGTCPHDADRLPAVLRQDLSELFQVLLGCFSGSEVE